MLNIGDRVELATARPTYGAAGMRIGDIGTIVDITEGYGEDRTDAYRVEWDDPPHYTGPWYGVDDDFILSSSMKFTPKPNTIQLPRKRMKRA